MFTIIPGSAAYTNGVADSNDAILFSGAVSELPAGKFGDLAYCISGTDKGKVYIYDGSAWVEQ